MQLKLPLTEVCPVGAGTHEYVFGSSEVPAYSVLLPESFTPVSNSLTRLAPSALRPESLPNRHMALIVIGYSLIVRPKGGKRKRKGEQRIGRMERIDEFWICDFGFWIETGAGSGWVERVKVPRKRSAPVQEGKTRAEHLFGDFDHDNSNGN